jgi:hypothetical protein
VYTPENKPRNLDKRAKFVKAQSMLGFLNEIEEVEEDDKPKCQTPVIYPGLQTFDPSVQEQSKESTDPNDNSALYVQASMDEHAQRQRALNKILMQHKIE